MHTERVTFLTTPDQKAALDAYATDSGRSIGHVVREATSRYIATPGQTSGEDEERALELLIPLVEEAVADMRVSITAMRASIGRACAAVDAVLAGETA